MSDYETLSWQTEEGVLILTLNRPDSLNALTKTMGEELIAAFARVNEADDVAAVVVTGAGRAFCAGMDLRGEGNIFGVDEGLEVSVQELTARWHDPEIVRGVRDLGGRMTLAIMDCRKPVIAAVNGPAVGIGATMQCAMDSRLASTDARVGFVFGRLGIVPEAASTWFLPRLVGLPTALEWAYSADIMDAHTLHRAGFVRSVHEPSELLAAAIALAHRFTDNRSPVATALTRQMMWRNSAQPDPREAHKIDSLAMWHTTAGDGKEGVAAFQEKRNPAFTGRASSMPDFYPWF